DLGKDERTPERIWDGVFPHYRDVPSRGAGYQGERLAVESVALARQFIEATARSPNVVLAPTVPEQSQLPLLALLVALRQGGVRILDFGGGAGIHYLQILRAFAVQDKTVDYHIVETPLLCGMAEILFKGDAQIRFHRDLPHDPERFDIVHACSVLQYIEDYA